MNQIIKPRTPIVTPFADQAFVSWPFKATGGTTPRTMPDRLADVVNVLEFGADPTNVADSAGAIQAAFNYAFGPPGSPHGLANAHLNRPVYIPNGNYKIGTTLTLTKVCGGYIFGAGLAATVIGSNMSSTLFATNGCSNLVIERLSFKQFPGVLNFDLNWDGDNSGPGCDGLHNNVFRDCGFGDGTIGVRIANGNHDGANNRFEGCIFGEMDTGIDAQSAEAVNNSVVGGRVAGHGIGYHCSAGQIHLYGACGDLSLAATPYLLRVDSNFPIHVVGGRSESVPNLFRVSAGIVSIYDHAMMGGTEFLNLTGGKVIMDCCFTSNGGLGKVNGTGGSLYMRGCSTFNAGSFDPVDVSGYSGTIIENI